MISWDQESLKVDVPARGIYGWSSTSAGAKRRQKGEKNALVAVDGEEEDERAASNEIPCWGY